MTSRLRLFRGVSKLAFRATSLPAFVALAVIMAGAWYAEQLNNRLFQHQNYADVSNAANLVASRLEGTISANVELVRGLASIVSTEPNIDQPRFADLAKTLFVGKNQLNNIAGAPDLVVSLMYPMAGNEKAIGLDYRRNEAQRDVALRARDTGEMTLAGPVDLVQGGQGFIARFPVFYKTADNEKAFWGILSSVISTEEIYAETGLNADPNIDYALVGKDASGPQGDLFFGSETTVQGDPVLVHIDLPNGEWGLAALPKGGWKLEADNVWIVRFSAIIAAILVVLPVSVMSWLFGERYRHLHTHRVDQQKLKLLSERLTLALETSQIGVWECNITSDQLHWDIRMRELYGCDAHQEVSVKTWRDSLHPEDVDRAVADFEEAIADKKKYVSEFRAKSADGDFRTIRAIGTVLQDGDNSVRIVGINWDVSAEIERTEMLNQARAESDRRYLELEVANARIESNSLHDFLTQLPNRRYLDEKLKGHFDYGFKIDGSCGLLKVDLDRFKEINDTLGHAAGDAMLVHASDVLRKNARSDDFIARIGGDEFIIFCQFMHEENRLEILAAAIIEDMQQPADYEGRKCRLGASVGIAHGESADGNPDKLLSNADLALYQAKNDGRNVYRFFTQKLHNIAVETRHVADDILAGIERGEFVAHFQGQFDAHTHALCGVEALARWNHPEKGLLPPTAFIDIAERLNVMGAIDAMILDNSLAEMENWRRAGLHVPRVSVNVSAKRLNDEDLIPSLKKLNFAPGSLTFELVESTFLDQREDMVAWNLDQIRELGIEIEIDDFGTGYASIVSLMELRPNRLKIDRQLVLPTAQSMAQRELVRSIVDIGASLGIGAIAEGVETMQHADIMRDLGCEMLQGFAFARPLSSQDFLAAQRLRLSA